MHVTKGSTSAYRKLENLFFWLDYMKNIIEVKEQCILCQENSTMISAEKYKNVLDVPHHS